MIKRIRIRIQGRVQGVGCRPFIYRVACRCGLAGGVYNDSAGVVIEVQGDIGRVDEFVSILEKGSELGGWPGLMEISSMETGEIAVLENDSEFAIGQSAAEGVVLSQVTADSATCSDCLREMISKKDFRYRYPFINCTNCGPRYTIVDSIPYDRCNTTMACFEMCEKCRMQYTDPGDRRFHAQPVACPDCGPNIWLADSGGKTIESDSDKALTETARMFAAGKVLAIKGLGGFHLAVDAKNEDAVKILRKRKRRDHKPFAMMAADIETISKYTVVDEVCRGILKSVESPVVLLEKSDDGAIAPSVAGRMSSFGFMLCYAPLHYLLFAQEDIEVLVMTSANLSDEPLICKNSEAVEKLGGIADAFLMHDRGIRRQVDDSVVQVVAGGQALIRRSRGFVPRPILRSDSVRKQIFAAGADLKNTFCFARGNQFIISEHIGDLADGRVYRHYIESIKHLQKLFEIQPEVFVCDLHPGYMSSQYVHSLGVKVFEIQHHWAHIGSVLAEYDYHDKVIGLVVDGTGLGTDGAIWGCECLIASIREFERFGHLKYYPLAGGNAASKEAVRPLLGLLNKSAGGDYTKEYRWMFDRIITDKKHHGVIAAQIEKNINSVSTSSMGRLFDAVAGMLGLGWLNRFDAELPMLLESVAARGVSESYTVCMDCSGGCDELDFRIMLKELIKDIQFGVEPGVMSAKFHNWVGQSMLGFALNARKKIGLNTVALAGGVFCNKYLANYTIDLLKKYGFFVLYKRRVPANDGGISLGQAAIAAAQTELGSV